MASRRTSQINFFLAIISSLLSIAFVLTILLSGVGGRTVARYLEIDTTDFSVPANLRGSTFLKDLTTVSGTDLVGQDADPETLGLAKRYSLSLLTTCAEKDGSTTCSSPQIGYAFVPGTDLKLDGVSIQGTSSDTYTAQLETYKKVSTFLGVGYVLAVLFEGLSVLCMILSRCFPRTSIVPLAGLSIAFLFLLASSIASVVVFTKLGDAFNEAFRDAGIKTETIRGTFGITFGATGLCLGAFLFLLAQSRSEKDRKWTSVQVVDSGAARKQAPQGYRGPGFAGAVVNRVKTWGQSGFKGDRSRSAPGDDDGARLLASSKADFDHESGLDIPLSRMDDRSRSPSRSRDPSRSRHPSHSRESSQPYDPPNATFNAHVDTSYGSHGSLV